MRAAPAAAALLIAIPTQGAAQATPEGVPWFEEVAEAAGLRFRHFRTEPPEYRLPEIMAGGVAGATTTRTGYPICTPFRRAYRAAPRPRETGSTTTSETGASRT